MDDCVRCNPIVTNSNLCETCQQILAYRIMDVMDEEFTETGGYDWKFFVDIPKHYECPLCLGALRDPVQIAGKCGHVFCEGCLNRATEWGPKTCPLDRKPFIQTFPDRSKRREVLSLKVTCQNSGCSWKGELLDLLNHLGQNCQKVRINCLNDRCRERIVKDKRKKIMNRSLPECILGNYVRNRKQKIVEHCLECNFPPIIPCTFVEFGCTFEGSGSQIDKHIKTALNEHFSLTTAKINQQENIINQQDNKINQQENKINQQDNKINQQENKLKQQDNKINQQENKINQQENKIAEINDKDIDLQNEIKNLKKQHAELQTKFNSISKKFEEKENTFPWSILNYQAKLKNAQNKKNPVRIYSPAFYTSHGYKFKLCAYLNGCSIGKNTHTSVFFNLCKGVNDDTLEWPFNKKITLTIVSHDDRVDDKTQTIVPAEEGEAAKLCFKKPTTDMIGWGRGKILPHTEKDYYIKDDIMVIKCVVR